MLREGCACNKGALLSSMIYVLLSTEEKGHFNTANKEYKPFGLSVLSGVTMLYGTGVRR